LRYLEYPIDKRGALFRGEFGSYVEIFGGGGGGDIRVIMWGIGLGVCWY
jgi:hypothetical protein